VRLKALRIALVTQDFTENDGIEQELWTKTYLQAFIKYFFFFTNSTLDSFEKLTDIL